MPAKLWKVRLELYGNLPSLSCYTETVENSSFRILHHFPVSASSPNQLGINKKQSNREQSGLGLESQWGNSVVFPLHYIQIDHPPNV